MKTDLPPKPNFTNLTARREGIKAVEATRRAAFLFVFSSCQDKLECLGEPTPRANTVDWLYTVRLKGGFDEFKIVDHRTIGNLKDLEWMFRAQLAAVCLQVGCRLNDDDN
jgi:hypothetical protein